MKQKYTIEMDVTVEGDIPPTDRGCTFTEHVEKVVASHMNSAFGSYPWDGKVIRIKARRTA